MLKILLKKNLEKNLDISVKWYNISLTRLTCYWRLRWSYMIKPTIIISHINVHVAITIIFTSSFVSLISMWKVCKPIKRNIWTHACHKTATDVTSGLVPYEDISTIFSKILCYLHHLGNIISHHCCIWYTEH